MAKRKVLSIEEQRRGKVCYFMRQLNDEFFSAWRACYNSPGDEEYPGYYKELHQLAEQIDMLGDKVVKEDLKKIQENIRSANVDVVFRTLEPYVKEFHANPHLYRA